MTNSASVEQQEKNQKSPCAGVQDLGGTFRAAGTFQLGWLYCARGLQSACTRYDLEWIGAKALRGCVFGEAEVCVCTRGHPERQHIGLFTYIPSLNFKKNKGTSSRRDFRRMVAEATFFNRASSWKTRVRDLPGPESNLHKT